MSGAVFDSYIKSVYGSGTSMEYFDNINGGNIYGDNSIFGGVNAAPAATLTGEQALLTSWRRLLDNGSLQDGEANLAGTARKTVAVISPKRASAIGVTDGDLVKISNDKGALVLPVLIEAIHDDAVWAPRNSAGSELLRTLGVASNSVVTVVKA